MYCWKCRKPLPEELKIAFRTSCPHCDHDLHTCLGCRYYSPGKPNDCLVPGTESVRDREAANLCEEFKVRLHSPNSPKEEPRKKFQSLFKPDDD